MQPAYAILRIDDFQDCDPINKITVKKVVANLEFAQSEVERLNKLNGLKGCRYFWQYTRIENSPSQTADS